MAGESAQRKYEELRDRRRQQPRWLWVLPVVLSLGVGAIGATVSHSLVGIWWPGAMLGVLVLSGFQFGPSRQEVAWRKGAEGERAVGRALDNVVGAVALHDRRIPRSRANIDHILIAGTGVWTVDAKNYTGKIGTRRRGSELWVNGRNRSKLLAQAQRQRDVVSRALAGSGLGQVPVRPTLCFLGVDWPLLFRPKSANGVALVSPRRLQSLVEGEVVLTPAEVQRVADAIDQGLRPAVASDTRRAPVQSATPTATPVPQPGKPGEVVNGPGEISVNRWRRYGKDRLYVNDRDGETLGYMDLETNEVVPTEERYRLVVGEAAAAYLRDA